jgi:hypothetical protein
MSPRVFVLWVDSMTIIPDFKLSFTSVLVATTAAAVVVIGIGYDSFDVGLRVSITSSEVDRVYDVRPLDTTEVFCTGQIRVTVQGIHDVNKEVKCVWEKKRGEEGEEEEEEEGRSDDDRRQERARKASGSRESSRPMRCEEEEVFVFVDAKTKGTESTFHLSHTQTWHTPRSFRPRGGLERGGGKDEAT